MSPETTERWRATVHSTIRLNRLDPNDYDVTTPWTGDASSQITVYCDSRAAAYNLATCLTGPKPWAEKVEQADGRRRHTVVCIWTPINIICDVTIAPKHAVPAPLTNKPGAGTAIQHHVSDAA